MTTKRKPGDLGRTAGAWIYRVAARIRVELLACEAEIERLVDAHVDGQSAPLCTMYGCKAPATFHLSMCLDCQRKLFAP